LYPRHDGGAGALLGSLRREVKNTIGGLGKSAHINDGICIQGAIMRNICAGAVERMVAIAPISGVPFPYV
jgi:hypothetical protein